MIVTTDLHAILKRGYPQYSGTQLNAYCLWNNVDNVALFCLIDLPMSLAVDTVILPYTLFSELTDIGYCNISNPEPLSLTPIRP